MNVNEMIKYCNKLKDKYGDEVVLSWGGILEVYDFENNRLEIVR